MNLRATRRAVTLGFALFLSFFWSLFLRLTGPDTMERRAYWNHTSAIMALKMLGIRLKVVGKPPERGLLVSNHLSYLEVLFFGAALPCHLVSKIEIASWPFFGTLARAGGTMFVDRSSRASAEEVTRQVAERLKGNVPVLFFPEGTSTDGSEVLRFHSRLFTPAVDAAVPVTSACIRYVPEDGSPERDLCWYGDAPFLPHLWKVMGGPNFSAELQFGPPRIFDSRRTAANQTHQEIEAMRAGLEPAESKVGGLTSEACSATLTM